MPYTHNIAYCTHNVLRLLLMILSSMSGYPEPVSRSTPRTMLLGRFCGAAVIVLMRERMIAIETVMASMDAVSCIRRLLLF